MTVDFLVNILLELGYDEGYIDVKIFEPLLM